MPNGVLLIDIKTEEITLASKEMKVLIGAKEDCEDLGELKTKVCTFLMQDQEVAHQEQQPVEEEKKNA